MNLSANEDLFSNYLNENANLSLKSRSTVCSLAYSFRRDGAVVGIVVLQTILSLLTLVFLYLLLRSKQMRRIFGLVGTDLKVIIFAGFLTYLVATVNIFLLFAYKSIILLLDLEACSYVWRGRTCYYAQVLYGLFCWRIYLIFHFSRMLERAYITFLNRGERCGGVFGAILALLMLVSGAAQMRVVEPRFYENDRIFCMSLLTVVQTNFVYFTYVAIAFVALISFCDLLLYLVNKHQIREYKRNLSNFNLENSFRLRELDLSIGVILPFSLVHALTYLPQSFMYLAYTDRSSSMNAHEGVLFFELQNLSRVLGNFALIGFLYLHIHFRRPKSNVHEVQDEAALHFRLFQQMIS